MEQRYRQLYLTLLGLTSVAVLAVLAYVVLDENLGRQWTAEQKQYARLLQAKAKTPIQLAAARRFDVSVRQVVVPALNRVDRCVSCHLGVDNPAMADAPMPFRAHPGKLLEQHPVEKFGCTICHRGQGYSLEADGAHATKEGVHWDYPLLSKDLMGSACGVCHDARWLGERGEKRLARGSELFHSRGCFGCHKLGGKGGTMSIPLDNEGDKIAELLVNRQSLLGEKTVEEWQMQHLLDPQRIVPESKMRNPHLTQDEALDLASYVHSLVDLNLPRHYVPEDHYQKFGFEQLGGEQLYARYCFACHGDGSYGVWVNEFQRFVPAIRNADFLDAVSDNYLATTVQEGREGTEMPAWKKSVGGLRTEEIGRLVEFLRSARPRRATQAVAPDLPAGETSKGAALFSRLCAGCHGVGGKGGFAPTLASKTFVAVADETFLTATIGSGRKNTAMPGFLGTGGLTGGEVADLVAYVRGLTRTPEEAAKLRKSQERSNY